jgi:hypothetical protein
MDAGDGSIPARFVTTGVGSKPGEAEPPLTTVRGASVGSSYKPVRELIAERGQALNDTGHSVPAIRRQQPRDILEHEQPGS